MKHFHANGGGLRMLTPGSMRRGQQFVQKQIVGKKQQRNTFFANTLVGNVFVLQIEIRLLKKQCCVESCQQLLATFFNKVLTSFC